jgi:hypothetical protein
MKLRRLGQAAIVLSGGYLTALAVTRRWHQHWGATDQEITTPLPGDDLISEARLDSTHAVGDAMPFYPGAPMTVAEADPPHALVLWQVTSGGKAIDPAGPWGEDYVAWSWAFVLEPVEVARTRLLVGMRVSYQPAFRWGPAMWLLVEPAHFVMGRRQLLGIRQRAETARLPDDQERTALPMTAGAEAVAEAVRAT